jgi:hypothetical protein
MLRQPFFISCAVSTAVVLILGGTLGKPVPSVSEQLFWQHVHLDRTLDQPAGLTAVDQPLAEVLQTLAERYAVPLTIHPDDLVGRQAVTINVHGVRLRSLLSLILEPHDLEFAVQERQVVVSSLGSLGVSPTPLIARVYPLPQPPVAWGGMNEEDWWEIIRTVIAPSSWDYSGGGASCEKCPGALVIVHLPEVHQQVTELLAHLESCRENPDPTAAIRLTNFAESPFEQRLQRILAQPCQVELFRAGLATALEYLSRQLDVPIVVSYNPRYHAALRKQGVVTVRSEGDPLSRVLNAILTPLELSFRVRRDCIEIVPLPEVASEWELRLYPVGDLIGDAKGNRIQRLSSLLRRFVELPNFAGAAERSTWTSELGDRMLLVEATTEAHDRAQRLLADLRACLVGLPPPTEPGEQAIQAMLDQPADLEFIHASLPSVVAWIEQNYGVPLEIDPQILAEPSVKITCRAQSGWLGVALRNVLGSVEVVYVVLPDRVLVTDHLRAVDYVRPHCFDVRPLIDPDAGVMTGPTLIAFLRDACKANSSFIDAWTFDGILVVCALEFQPPRVAEILDRLANRLDRLPRDREFSAAYRLKQMAESAASTSDQSGTLRQAYFDALHAAMEDNHAN